MTLDELRKEIDAIDDTILQAFAERMSVVSQIGQLKKEQNLPILDVARENAKLVDLAAKLPPEMEQYGYALYSMIFELSRSYQSSIDPKGTALRERIQNAIEHTPPMFPQSAVVACQGVPGAYSQLACEKMFRRPQVMYFKSFDNVFSAIENGFCQYGILPLENSTAGSVTQVYDLMRRHNFRIVRSTRLKVDHNLLVKRGTKMEDIKQIYSHQQAISQCAAFLEKLGPGVQITPCANTAMAAKMVAESDRTDVAALSSHPCMALYNLECLASDIQDRSNNYTRFICISKNLEIYPGADRTSVMMILPHRPGSLYRIISRFYALGLNLIKLESRPLPDREFEFMFYFDLQTSIYSDEYTRMINDLNVICEDFQYLGSYSEVL